TRQIELAVKHRYPLSYLLRDNPSRRPAKRERRAAKRRYLAVRRTARELRGTPARREMYMPPSIASMALERSGWRRGPWMNEPDKLQWTASGYPAVMVRNHVGAWCG